jgi:anti-sigma regulatory factor (Ser/Thr protein kinase)
MAGDIRDSTGGVGAMRTAARVADPATDPGPFEHLGLLYRDTAQYLAGITEFVRAALAAGSPVLVAVPPSNLNLIREALGGHATGITFTDMTVAGRNPGRIIPGVLLTFVDAHPGRRVSIIGEPIWPGRSPLEYPACGAHEALINAVFAGTEAAILCPYDVRGLDRDAIADAHRTHPTMVEDGNRWASSAYTDPYATAASFNEPLPPAPVGAASLTYQGPAALAEVRRFAADQAARAGLDADRAAGLAIAVNELASNTTAHTSAAGRVSIWAADGTLVCQVEDGGHIRDPLAGRIPPAPTAPGGRGLVLVNHLCDLVRIHTQPRGTTIRLHHYL